MAFARNSLKSFLKYSKTSLANAIAKGDKVTFVIGNEVLGSSTKANNRSPDTLVSRYGWPFY